jgi:hypothetical protein
MIREANIWRQVTAITVAWLFALQVMLSTLASVAALSNYQADQTISFTLCQHDGASADQPAAPSPSVPCSHCPLCLASGHTVDVAIVAALLTVVVYVSRLRWVPAGVTFIAPPVPDDARPRGPPFPGVTWASPA